MSAGVDGRVLVGPAELRTRTWGVDRPTLVFLHDGLGSIGQWRDVPARVAAATGATVLAYDRAGHGSSTPVPSGPWPTGWLEHEAGVLGGLLDRLGIARPVLVGHSDGGSISLLHAAEAGSCVAGVVALAAHSYVEPVCVRAIVGMRRQRDRIVAGLTRHHAAPDAVFDAWSGVWTSEAFRAWDIRPRLGAVTAPTVIVQGDRDEYATAAMVDETVAAIGPNSCARRLPGVGHLLHHQAPAAVTDLVAELVASVAGGGGGGATIAP